MKIRRAELYRMLLIYLIGIRKLKSIIVKEIKKTGRRIVNWEIKLFIVFFQEI